MNTLKALAGTIKSNGAEIALYVFLSAGLPLVALMYVDIRLAITSFIGVQIVLLVLNLKFKGNN